MILASNFSLDEYPSHRSLGGAPGPRQPPFSAGISVVGPICPVMFSCCLSVGSLRFLILPVPTKEFGSLAVSLLRVSTSPETSLGFPRFARLRCNWSGCLLYYGEWVSSKSFDKHGFPLFPSSSFQPLSMTSHNAASSEIHSRSPAQFSPSPVASCG
jgi:hypothetical protein